MAGLEDVCFSNCGGGDIDESSINELMDVNVTSPQDGDILIYNSDTGAWINGTQNTQGNNNIGYFGLLTDFYNGGLPSKTTIAEEGVDTWTDVVFEAAESGGLFDYRPKTMADSVADPYDDDTGFFSLEGLTVKSFGTFRASMEFLPTVDEGEIEVRLVFKRHSGTTPSDNFYIEQVAMVMNQGADRDYPAEPTLTFFVGDTIDTNATGDAGSCKFQVKSTVPGVVKMKALTWYLTE